MRNTPSMRGAVMSKRPRSGTTGIASGVCQAVLALSLAAYGDVGQVRRLLRSRTSRRTPRVRWLPKCCKCDHAQDAFRDGDLGDADQASALSAELQGMIDVAKPGAARLLGPMIKAADAIAAGGRDQSRPALRQAEIKAYRVLGRACTRAGSRAW